MLYMSTKTCAIRFIVKSRLLVPNPIIITTSSDGLLKIFLSFVKAMTDKLLKVSASIDEK